MWSIDVVILHQNTFSLFVKNHGVSQIFPFHFWLGGGASGAYHAKSKNECKSNALTGFIILPVSDSTSLH